jgi:hypothetical protein
MRIVSIVRTTIPYDVIARSFAQIVKDVFQNYTISAGLEEGLNQLNSLRLDTPLDLDCVVKLKDENFLLKTDDEGKIVFCIFDDSFEYKVDQNNDVLCFFEGEFMCKAEGRVDTWYRHIQSNVDLVAINYLNFTTPSRNLDKY